MRPRARALGLGGKRCRHRHLVERVTCDREVPASYARESEGELLAKAKGVQAPTHAGVKYGPHARNLMDVWLADSDEPTPVVLSFHAGGFKPRPDPSEAKSDTAPALKGDLRGVLRAGIAVAMATHDGIAPEPFEDARRAVQFIRSMAPRWNLDKGKVAATGTSSGGCLSLWLCFHKDMAKPKAKDPVERESTRLSCAAVNQAVTSLDPRFIRDLMPGCTAYRRFEEFFGYEGQDLDSLPKMKYDLMEELSPINHLRKGGPPTLLRYTGKLDAPFGIHHAAFGEAFMEKSRSLGVLCDLVAGGKPVGDSQPRTIATFLKQTLCSP